MPPKTILDAENEKRKYRWTNQLITNVYSQPANTGGRELLAHLLVGEWIKLKDDVIGDEQAVKFRGGEGYIAKNAIGENRLLEIYSIDVGQGDSFLIQTPDDKRILIDGGRDESAHSFLRWKYNLKKYPTIFDAVILTHGDEDHVAGLSTILNDENVIVKAIYHNGIAKESDGKIGKTTGSGDNKYLTDLYNDVDDLNNRYSRLNSVYKNWVDAVKTAKVHASKENIALNCQRADQNTPKLSFSSGQLTITFLGPLDQGTAGNPKLACYDDAGKTINGNSLSVLLEYNKARILLCGDRNARGEKQILDRWGGDLNAQVFKANHHGSPDFSTDFLDAVKPWITIVSSGDEPDYGHPRANLLGSLGRYAPEMVKEPLLFSTEIAATFKRIPDNQKNGVQIYEKCIHGLINVRSNGEWLVAGRIYGKTKNDPGKPSKWSWEAYALRLDDACQLKNDFTPL
jgi:beta-lactamase superfamily II metal-dependent hydrolase